MVAIELAFPALGQHIQLDHGYALYSAISGVLPALHNGALNYRLGPIAGERFEPGLLRLNDRSRVRFRLLTDDLPQVLPLAGKRLIIGGNPIRLGVPQVRTLMPAPMLVARLVTIKGFTEPGPFLEAVGRQLAALGIALDPAIPLAATGPRAGQPQRRVIRVKDKRIVGFPVQVSGLSAEDSIRIQERGLGGRSRMGCGFFVPVKESQP